MITRVEMPGSPGMDAIQAAAGKLGAGLVDEEVQARSRSCCEDQHTSGSNAAPVLAPRPAAATLSADTGLPVAPHATVPSAQPFNHGPVEQEAHFSLRRRVDALGPDWPGRES